MTIKKGIYKHFKGNMYELIDIATHSETLEDMVIYKPLYECDKKVWVRPLAMWNEEVEYQGKTVKRFEFIKETEKE